MFGRRKTRWTRDELNELIEAALKYHDTKVMREHEQRLNSLQDYGLGPFRPLLGTCGYCNGPIIPGRVQIPGPAGDKYVVREKPHCLDCGSEAVLFVLMEERRKENRPHPFIGKGSLEDVVPRGTSPGAKLDPSVAGPQPPEEGS